MSSNIKCVIFDCDGVVINPHDMFFERYNYETNGLYKEKINNFFRTRFNRCLLGVADLKNELDTLLPEIGYSYSSSNLMRTWFQFESNIDRKVVKYIADLRNRGIKCYLATNQEKYRLRYLKDTLGFDGIFDGIFASCEVRNKKPDVSFFTKMIEQIRSDMKKQGYISSEEILFVDDNLDNVRSASNMCLNTILYSSFSDLRRFNI